MGRLVKHRSALFGSGPIDGAPHALAEPADELLRHTDRCSNRSWRRIE